MKKLFFNYILPSIFLVACFSFKAGAQSIQAESKLQQYTIRIGDQTRLFLVVHQPVKEHVNFPKLTDTITGKVLIVRSNKADTSFDKNDAGNMTVTRIYIITSFDAGTYTIPAFYFGVGGGIVKSNELTLRVETVKVDTTKAIYDIKQPLTVSYTFFDWLKDNWLLVGGSIVAILVIVGMIIYLQKRPKSEPVVKIKKPEIPAHVMALKKLQELKDKKLWQQEQVKQYYIELSDVIREYLEKRYVIKTHEKTTDEIFSSLRHMAIAPENREKLRQMLVLADLVKFAKERPLPVDNEQSMDSAISFVMNTQQVPQPLNVEGGNNNA